MGVHEETILLKAFYFPIFHALFNVILKIHFQIIPINSSKFALNILSNYDSNRKELDYSYLFP